jgi:histone-lysine N-methyltransferase ASH1L
MTGIFASLFDRMGSTSKPEPDLDITRACSSDSTISDASVDINSNAQSSSSTPPTSIGDTISISSTSFKLEQTQITSAEEPSGRSRRQRTSVGTYNVKFLSGTAIHAPRKYLKDKTALEDLSRRKTISGEELATISQSVPSTNTRRRAHSLNSHDISALDLEWVADGVSQKSSKVIPRKGQSLWNKKRKATDKLTASVTTHGQKIGVLGKRRRLNVEDKYKGLGKAKRELRNLADTNEFAKIDTQPIVHEIWSNGKLVVLGTTSAKAKTTRGSRTAQPLKDQLVDDVNSKKLNRKKEKIWLPMGLYAGQEPVENLNWFKTWGGPKDQEKDLPPFKPDGFLPLPMWHGQRLLHTGRDFKLPFDVCAPLPPGQPKPDEWHRTSSSKFIHHKDNTMLTNQIDLLVRLERSGRSQAFLIVSPRSVSAHQKAVVTRIARTGLCSMNVMILTVHPVGIVALTEHSPSYRSAGRGVASSELVSK